MAAFSGGPLRLIFAVTLLGIACGWITIAGPAEDEASASGEKWLVLLDNQKYEESWRQAGSMFREEVKQEQWIASLQRFREPLGETLTRVVARVDFTRALRGAPDADYAIIHYTTDFKNKSAVTERLTLVKEDGRWQTAAYATH
jgi:Protein of unknown function (DUF4019)